MERYRIAFCVLCVCLFMVSTVMAEDITGFQTRPELSGASWTAAENWVTRLSLEEQQRLLGGKLPEISGPMSMEHPVFREFTRDLPDTFTWCDCEGFDWMTDVKNQGGCGACAAFSACGSVEALVRIVRDDPNYPVDLSEQHLFSCAGGDCPTGLYMGTAFDYFTANGVPDDACLPYTAVDGNCADSCEDWRSRVVQLDGWDLLWQYTVDEEALKSYVFQQPVSCYLEVYSDFASYQSGVYEYTSGSLLGGHFVVIVGWDDALDCWICKNSWGAGWGENGYFRIKRGEVEIGSWAMLPFYTVPPTPTPTPEPTSTPIPSPTPPADLGITLELSQLSFRTGDEFYLNAMLSNPGPALSPVAMWVILDVYSTYWFYPGWVQYPDIAYTWVDLMPGISDETIIAPFLWPDVTGSAEGLIFWAALLDADMQTILGTLDSVEWGYGSD